MIDLDVRCVPMQILPRHPLKNALRRNCATCGCEVWLAPSTQQMIVESEARPTFYCMECSDKAMSESPIFAVLPPTDEMRRERDVIRDTYLRRN